jgi:hypothetical protein
MKLSNTEVNYSKRETEVFRHLSKKRLTTTEITNKLYAKKEQPLYARQSVLMALVSLRKKIDKNREPFVLKKTKRSGPYPLQFWLEDR